MFNVDELLHEFTFLGTQFKSNICKVTPKEGDEHLNFHLFDRTVIYEGIFASYLGYFTGLSVKSVHLQI